MSGPRPNARTAALKHGATGALCIAPRASEIADDLRALVPTGNARDEPAIRLLALVLARVEAANVWLDEHGLFRNVQGEPQPVLKAAVDVGEHGGPDLDRLGLTPTSRAALGLDVVRTGDALAEHIEKHYGDDGKRKPSQEIERADESVGNISPAPGPVTGT